MSQNVAPGPPVETATATPAMLPMPTVPDTAVVSALELRDLARVVLVGIPPRHDTQGLGESPDVDETQVDGEEQSATDEPDHDQRQVGAQDRDGEEDEPGDGIGHRTHGRVDDPVESHSGTITRGHPDGADPGMRW